MPSLRGIALIRQHGIACEPLALSKPVPLRVRPRLIQAHDFPHICPGDDCAVCRWVFGREYRRAERDAAAGADSR